MERSQLRSRLNRYPSAGFTLIELVVVMALIIGLALLAAPAIREAIYRAQLSNGAQIAQVLMSRGRQASISGQRPVVALIGRSPASGDLGPQSYLVVFTLDGSTRIAMEHLPNVVFEGPVAPVDLSDATDGLTTVDVTGFPVVDTPHGTLTLSTKGIVFEPDGSVRDPGAFRMAHRAPGEGGVGRFSYRELRVSVVATGRVSVLRRDAVTGLFVQPVPTGTYTT